MPARLARIDRKLDSLLARRVRGEEGEANATPKPMPMRFRLQALWAASYFSLVWLSQAHHQLHPGTLTSEVWPTQPECALEAARQACCNLGKDKAKMRRSSIMLVCRRLWSAICDRQTVGQRDRTGVAGWHSLCAGKSNVVGGMARVAVVRTSSSSSAAAAAAPRAAAPSAWGRAMCLSSVVSNKW